MAIRPGWLWLSLPIAALAVAGSLSEIFADEPSEKDTVREMLVNTAS